ncbi:phosphoadenosine phosphosulfate reductase domain-containing protein [Gorillibacterium sp. sgz5001074]|uniref:phosphoadenosine phosphosulfate reductase domain-containing protein n=1 Tax=Gorillibacterium sp. sgz5001074 TaxID=3446695 RepID=UPI003F66652D
MDYKDKSRAATIEILKAYADGSDLGPWQVAYSGGKDSTVTAALVLRALLMIGPEKRNRKVYITSAQTKLDLTTDPTKQHEFEKMRKLILDNNLPVEIAEVSASERSEFLFCVLGLGYPLPHNGSKERWCTHKLKIEPQHKFMKALKPSLTIVGVRIAESISREAKINELTGENKYFGNNRTFMPIVHFTVEDVWSYLAEEKTPWGDAEEISKLYKDATGECGLRRRKAGSDEDSGDACGARFGCIICPVVKIDRSTRELSKLRPWFEPYANIRDEMIQMFKDPKNRAGYRRNGKKEGYGKGTFSVMARMKLFEKFLQAQEDNRILATMFKTEPQPLITDGLIDRIKEQWKADLEERPWLESEEELGQFFDERLSGRKDGFQITWNPYYNTSDAM